MRPSSLLLAGAAATGGPCQVLAWQFTNPQEGSLHHPTAHGHHSVSQEWLFRGSSGPAPSQEATGVVSASRPEQALAETSASLPTSAVSHTDTHKGDSDTEGYNDEKAVLRLVRLEDSGDEDAVTSALLRLQQHPHQPLDPATPADEKPENTWDEKQEGILNALREWQLAENGAAETLQKKEEQQQQQQKQKQDQQQLEPLLLAEVIDSGSEGSTKPLMPHLPPCPGNSSNTPVATSTATSPPATATVTGPSITAEMGEAEDPRSNKASISAAAAAVAAGLQRVADAAAAGKKELLSAAAEAAGNISAEGARHLVKEVMNKLGPPVVLRLEVSDAHHGNPKVPPGLLLDCLRDQTRYSMHFRVHTPPPTAAHPPTATAASKGEHYLMRFERAKGLAQDEAYTAAEAKRQKLVHSALRLLQKPLPTQPKPQEQLEPWLVADAKQPLQTHQQQPTGQQQERALSEAKRHLLLPLWVGQLTLPSPAVAVAGEDMLLNWVEIYPDALLRLQQLPMLQPNGQWFVALQLLKATAALHSAGLHLGALGPASPWISSDGRLLLDGVHSLQQQQQQRWGCEDEELEQPWRAYVPPEQAFCEPAVPPKEKELWEQHLQQLQRQGVSPAEAAAAWGLGLLLFHVFCSTRLPYSISAVASTTDTLRHLRRLFLAAVAPSSGDRSTGKSLNLKTCGSDPRAHRLLKALLHPNPSLRASPALLLQQLLQEEQLVQGKP
ncbi:uncharacterized protein LOC34620691 [Cyclospora cayetanensis]|uniref:Uncharacterized protein LOC34620691 n=1 Tax=Cyclospora cayetanensis TaxID=88456 RepID=A0A6P6RYU7_9EIME|nr:uncharacterized protein LOC34620691 [Cyclospora cayetanensis]